MAVYIFSQSVKGMTNHEDSMRIYKEQMLRETSAQIKYIFTEIPEQKDIYDYKASGICCMYQYLTDKRTLESSMKVKDKLEELKSTLHCTKVSFRDTEIWLFRNGYVVVSILLDEKDRDYFWGIRYFDHAKLLRMELYTDGIAYTNSYTTAISEYGLYAKLAKRTFYNRDGLVAYDQIFESDKEWFLFPNGAIYTKLQVVEEFLKRLNLSKQDTIILDAFVPEEVMRAVFAFGKVVRIVALAYVGHDYVKDKNSEAVFSKELYYEWFPYIDMLDAMVVSTEEQKHILLEELKRYHRNVPDIRVVSLDGEFHSTVLYESYGGNLALSWEFRGRTDGFWIYDESGVRICETRDVHQHYFLIKGYRKETGFVIKAFVDTLQGEMVTTESEKICLCETRRYERPVVSLIIPAYNAGDYIVRSMDTVLAQSFSDLEIVVVNDGSTDSTAEVIDWYAQKYRNVRVIHQKNGGLVAARNAGIEAAKGEYIAFMDNDDTIRPDMVARLHCSIIVNDCDIAVTSAFTVTNKGYVKYLKYALKEDVAMTIDEFLTAYVGNELGVVIWNKLYRAALVKTHKLSVFPFEDVAWTPYILSYADKICYLNDGSYEWDRSVRDNTLSDEIFSQNKEKLFEQYKKAVLFYIENGKSERRGLLKMVANRELHRWEKRYVYEEYGKLWQWIDENY